MEKTIFRKLNIIQVKLKCQKGNYNNFGKYKYRSCEDILEAVKPLLEETKTIVVISDEITQVGDRYYVKATAQLIDCDNGDTISNSALAREEEKKTGMDVSQLTGSTSSYARKYALNGLFALDDTDDADTESYHVKTSVKPQNEHILDKKLVEDCESLAIDLNALATYFKKTKEQLTNKDLQFAIDSKMKKLDKKGQ